MFAEALENIQAQAVKAADAKVVGGVKLRNRTLLHHDGKTVDIANGLPERKHTASDLASFAAIVKDYGGEGSTVFHHSNSVVGVLDNSKESYRDDTVGWTLTESTKWNALVKMAPTPRDHASCVRFLVQNLRDELDAAAPGLLGTLRNLKFRTGDEQTGDVKQGRESMGRQIEQEVAGATDLPETVLIKVRRWASLDYSATVECLLVLDVQERKLSLRPLADQLEQAEHGAQEWLGNQLDDAVECPVYYGTP